MGKDNPPTKYDSNRIFVLNEPNAPRLNPALAVEIGLNESLVFLQLEFWIATSGKEIDGRRWVYESVRDLQKCFPFWSTMTINRAIKSLVEKGLVVVANYNQAKYDRTRWFAINLEEAAKLESIAVRGYVTRSDQNDTRSGQNDTTIPETSTETSYIENTAATESTDGTPIESAAAGGLSEEPGKEGRPAAPLSPGEKEKLELLMSVPKMDPVVARGIATEPGYSAELVTAWTGKAMQLPGAENVPGLIVSRIRSGEFPQGYVPHEREKRRADSPPLMY